MSDQFDDDPEHRVHQELQDKDEVEHTEPFGSSIVGEPPRHWVQFKPELTEVPQSFQNWMIENDLAAMSARMVTENGQHQLVIELQHLSKL